MLALYGDRLIATHINDNLGVSDYTGEIKPQDDLHLLPFDGVKDWTDFAQRIQKCGYNGALTFELKLASQPGRHENDAYREMPFERYLAEAYKRACRVATLVQKQ
jgi:sugar phosphate isomerase/epimerase